MKNQFILLIVLSTLPLMGVAQWSHINETNTCDYEVIKFQNELEGWAMGKRGYIQRTTDGGVTWDSVTCNSNEDIFDFQFIEDTVGFCAGAYSVLKYNVEDDEWNIIASFNEGYIKGIHFFDRNNGLIIGGGIRKTTDGGLTWNIVEVEGISESDAVDFTDIVFVNDLDGFIACWYYMGSYEFRNLILKTTDGGNNWEINFSEIVSNEGIVCDLCTVPDYSDVLYVSTTTGKIFKTTNCGDTWDTIYSANVMAHQHKPMFFTDSETGYMASVFLATFGIELGEIEIWKTTDGAQTWHRQLQDSVYNHAIKSMYFINDSIGFAAGHGNMYKTENGGGTVGIPTNMKMNELDVFVYPNPTNKYLNINVDEAKCESISCKISDVSGKVLESFSASGHKPTSQQIDISVYPEGVYFLLVRCGKSMSVKKFIKL